MADNADMIFAEQNIHPAVSDAAFKRFLRFPPRRPFEGPLAENAAWARDWFVAHAEPWYCAREVPVSHAADGTVLIGEERFGGTALAARFAGVTSAVAVAASAGPEVDAEAAARWTQGEPDRYFFLEAYASAVVEALIAKSQRCVASWAEGFSVMPCYCPGFAGWPADEARAFLNVICAGGILPGPLAALASGAQRPKKSKLGLFGMQPALTSVAL